MSLMGVGEVYGLATLGRAGGEAQNYMYLRYSLPTIPITTATATTTALLHHLLLCDMSPRRRVLTAS